MEQFNVTEKARTFFKAAYEVGKFVTDRLFIGGAYGDNAGMVEASIQYFGADSSGSEGVAAGGNHTANLNPDLPELRRTHAS